MFKIIDDESPDLLSIAFDVSGPTFRHDMYEEYKGTKSQCRGASSSSSINKEVLSAMGISIVEKAGYEADDIIGTLANESEKLGYDVSVVSGDRDLLQLATDKVKIIIPKLREQEPNREYFAKDVKKNIK